MEKNVKLPELLYPELSYKIVGCAFEVFNDLGPGHEELIYKKALCIAFDNAGIDYKCEYYIPLKFKDQLLKKNFADFMVADSIIVELKSTNIFSRANINQTLGYLKTTNKKLALLINFGKDKVYSKRIPNLF